jgi:hypothetical protein
MKSFHDDALNVTYFYPAEFVAAPSSSTPADPSKCIRSTFFAYTVEPSGSSSFALSTIDNTCPDTLRSASELGPFTRAQVLSQLKRYGEPQITLEPSVTRSPAILLRLLWLLSPRLPLPASRTSGLCR